MKTLFEKIRYNYGKLLLFGIMAAFYLTHGCPVRFLTGIACPGCGMSRAAMALLRLDFNLAFEMHPLVFLLPIATLVYFTRKFIPKKALSFIYAFALIMLIAVYIIRIKAGCSITCTDIENGIIYKILNNINAI